MEWSKQEIDLLKYYYLKAGDIEPLDLAELETIFNRLKSNICRKAKSLGLPTNVHRKQTENVKEIMSKNSKKQIKENGHSRGYLGHKHTEEFKIKMSKRVEKEWQNPNSKLNSEEVRQIKSDSMLKLQRQGKLRNGYSRGKQGKRKDLGNKFFRSSWESNYARYLNLLIEQGKIYKWKYEADVFEFKEINIGIRSYIPDFKIWENKNSTPYYVEVKGWMDKKSKIKLNRMDEYYPDVRVELFGEKEYKELQKLSHLIKYWE